MRRIPCRKSCVLVIHTYKMLIIYRDSSLTTGSKIGIAFGAIIGGMLLGLLLLWAYVSSLCASCQSAIADGLCFAETILS